MIYTTRFVGGRISTVAHANALAYVVPAGKVAVIRSIDSVTVAVGLVNVGYTPTGGFVCVWTTDGVPANRNGHWEGRQVVRAGESITLQFGSGDHWVSVTGYLLSAPP